MDDAIAAAGIVDFGGDLNCIVGIFLVQREGQ
jgi:hypothetical protein